MLNELIKQLSGGFANNVAKQTKLDKSNVTSLISLILPALIGGMNKNANSKSGLDSLFGALSSDHDGSLLKNVNKTITDQACQIDGGKICSKVLGSNSDKMVNSIAKETSVDSSKVGSIMSMLAPIVMAKLGSSVKSGAIDAAGLSSLLSKESKMTPSGLFNMASNSKTTSSRQSTSSRTSSVKSSSPMKNDDNKKGLGWLWPLVLFGALGYLLFNWISGDDNSISDTINDATDTIDESVDNVTDSASSVIDEVENTVNNDSDNNTTDLSEKTIYQFINDDARFTTLTGLVNDFPGLMDLLKTNPTNTLFAPTDSAFDALGQDAIDGLSQNDLYVILGLHHLDDDTSSAVVTANPVLNTVEGDITIADVEFVETDLSLSNGVVHIIDNVLLP